MLEGQDEAGSFFTTVSVAATSQEEAESIAVLHAKESGCSSIRIEETTLVGENDDSGSARILGMSGRSYFPSGE